MNPDVSEAGDFTRCFYVEMVYLTLLVILGILLLKIVCFCWRNSKDGLNRHTGIREVGMVSPTLRMQPTLDYTEIEDLKYFDVPSSPFTRQETELGPSLSQQPPTPYYDLYDDDI